MKELCSTSQTEEAIEPEIVDSTPFDETEKDGERPEFYIPSPEDARKAFPHASTFGIPIDDDGHVNAIGCAQWMAIIFTDIVYVSFETRLYRRCLKTGRFFEVSTHEFMLEILAFLAFVCENVMEYTIGFKFTPAVGEKIMAFFLDFKRDDHFFDHGGKIILPLQNCFLVWEHEAFVEYPLSTEWIHSRKMLNATYNPQAKPAWRFIHELLAPVFSADEIEAILLYAAQCVLGKNISQTILIITGEAGTGKSVIVNIIEGIIGESNVTQLRTECLGGHFETQRYENKSLLTGKDVPPDFLQKKGASMLKALTGNDLMATETKHSSEIHQIRGNFNVIVTSNSSQPIAIQHDRGAWARRVRVVHSKGEKPKEPIAEFEKVLLAEEGEGIFLEILQHLETLLKNGGHIQPSPEQQQAIDNFLDESESPDIFLTDCVEIVEPKPGESLRKCEADLTSEELYIEYKAYCATRGWTPIPARKFQNQLVDLMPQKFDRFRVYDIVREGTKHRGYYAVRLK